MDVQIPKKVSETDSPSTLFVYFIHLCILFLKSVAFWFLYFLGHSAMNSFPWGTHWTHLASHRLLNKQALQLGRIDRPAVYRHLVFDQCNSHPISKIHSLSLSGPFRYNTSKMGPKQLYNVSIVYLPKQKTDMKTWWNWCWFRRCLCGLPDILSISEHHQALKVSSSASTGSASWKWGSLKIGTSYIGLD